MRFRQSAALLRELTERAAVATFLVGTNGELFYSNQACCDLLGYEPHETSGLALTDIIHPDHLATTRQQLSGLNRGEAEDYRAERQYLRKNGDAIWVDVRAAILRHERSGRPLYVIVQAIDIDRRKKAEAALAEAESRWNFALEGAGQGVWDHDLRNKRAFFSRTWKLMRGLDPDAPVDPAAAAWLDKVHPDDRDRIRDTIRRQDAGEIPHNAFEYRERHR
ncbi:MAG: PAS domain S-box protein, partial [Bauldia sp.]